jgi:uncharacterized protein (DUF488 family)
MGKAKLSAEICTSRLSKSSYNMQNTIFSVGHSVRGFSEFLQKLTEYDVDVLVDVRTFPRSWHCPQYNRKRLADGLNKANITYLFKGRNLGGRGENTAYEETIDELVNLVRNGKRICLMCSEADYRKCHRHELLEPSFIKRGCKVEHIS